MSNDAALRIKAAHVGLAAKLDSPGWRLVDGLDGSLVDSVFDERSVGVDHVPGDGRAVTPVQSHRPRAMPSGTPTPRPPVTMIDGSLGRGADNAVLPVSAAGLLALAG